MRSRLEGLLGTGHSVVLWMGIGLRKGGEGEGHQAYRNHKGMGIWRQRRNTHGLKKTRESDVEIKRERNVCLKEDMVIQKG